ncbi:unnamed protein product [Mytilus coruscus]|uniref:Uncharacterized protein n=1 Tax=Mytilus coruscus TaxID=42192 RepID=A0A6J8E7B5_MYTCO|nr:unnamed protein product [Mytilus coruscus]
MDYKLVHSVQYEDCNVQRGTSDEAESMWYKKPVWKWFCGGLAIESSQSLQYQANTSLIKNEVTTIDLKQFSTSTTTTFYLPQSTAALKTIHTCQVADQTIEFACKVLMTAKSITNIDPDICDRITRAPGAAEDNIMHAHAHGGCNQPPKLKDGMECVFESKDGRLTSFRYTLLAKQNVDTVDHCPVSYCQGQNYWSMFNGSLSGMLYTNKRQQQPIERYDIHFGIFLLTKQNVDTVDHCLVSYCQGQNYWSVFNASLSGMLYTNKRQQRPNERYDIHFGTFLLTKQNVDTVDHCPMSYCQGQNYWSVFNASLSGMLYTKKETAMTQ